jgi:hypothetical protein
MNWWMPRNDATARITYPYFDNNDPGRALSLWRVVKLERGLVRHCGPGVRVPACRELLLLGGWGQDECWEMLSDADPKTPFGQRIPEDHDNGCPHLSARGLVSKTPRLAEQQGELRSPWPGFARLV